MKVMIQLTAWMEGSSVSDVHRRTLTVSADTDEGLEALAREEFENMLRRVVEEARVVQEVDEHDMMEVGDP